MNHAKRLDELEASISAIDNRARQRAAWVNRVYAALTIEQRRRLLELTDVREEPLTDVEIAELMQLITIAQEHTQ